MKYIRFSLVFIVLLFATILGITTVSASSNRNNRTNPSENEKIRELIQNYFDIRYRSRAINQIGDLSELTDGSSTADSFLKSETNKLEIEIHNSKLHHLGYIHYEYTLDFNDISLDKKNQSATVLLTEGHDVVFEISALIYKTDPIISKMRDLYHTIVLKKTQNGWKIVSDHYEDYLWRMLRITDFSKAELLRSIDDNRDQESIISKLKSLQFSCGLPADISSHTYNRSGTIAYAHQYALTPNPEYFYFPFPYGDCTNFVNQAIHHGSNAEEFGRNDNLGWYYGYYNSSEDNDYSASWTHVQYLYDLITQYWVWPRPGIDDPNGPGGPEGCLTDQYNALPGDLVQFEWLDPDTNWDHSNIIVQRGIYGSGYQYWVAGHSDNIDNYPLDSIIYQSRRFVRIDRIDGYFKAYVPVIRKDSSGYRQNIVTNPYPAPIEPNVSIQLESYPESYPAP